MPNKILRVVLNKERGLLGEMELDLYEADLLAIPFNLKNWSKFTQLRKIFQ